MDTDKRDEQTYAIIGAAMDVHRELGHGFLEAVYQEALAAELGRRAIPFLREATIPVYYKGKCLNVAYRADFVCHDSILLELKALSVLKRADEAQVINYLKASGLKKALLFNFGAPKLDYRRLVLDLRESATSADLPLTPSPTAEQP